MLLQLMAFLITHIEGYHVEIASFFQGFSRFRYIRSSLKGVELVGRDMEQYSIGLST